MLSLKDCPKNALSFKKGRFVFLLYQISQSNGIGAFIDLWKEAIRVFTMKS